MESKCKLWDFVKQKCSGTFYEQQKKVIFYFLLPCFLSGQHKFSFIIYELVKHLLGCICIQSHCGRQTTISIIVFCLYNSAASSNVVRARMGCALLGCICAYQKQPVSQSFIESSSWLRVFLKNMFILSSWLTFPHVWVLCLQEEKLKLLK